MTLSNTKWRVFAFDRATNDPVTGNAASITAKLSINHGAAVALTDTNPTETEDGYYLFDLTLAERTGSTFEIYPESSTGGVQVIGVPGYLSTGDAGTGARTVLITVNLSGSPVEGASVGMSKGGESFGGVTNASGQVTFNVNDGTWTVAITASGATFAGTTLVVDGNETVTYSVTPISFDVSDVGKRTGYTLCLDENGDPEEDVVVSIQCVAPPLMGVAMDSKVRYGASGADGIVQFTNLVVGAEYAVRRSDDTKFRFIVPAGTGPVELISVLGKD